MTMEEDLAVIKLRDRVVAEASKPDASPILQFRLRLLQRTAVLESVSREAWELRRLERLGRVDKIGCRHTDEYWEEVHKVTEPDDEWKPEEETYNINKDSRARPPPPQQATLWY